MRPPHGFKPKYDLGIDWWQLVWVLGAVAALAIVAFYLWRWWKSQSRRDESHSASVPQGPGRVAELLGALNAMHPQEPFDARARADFYWRLGLGLRAAVEWRTGTRATALTLRELREPLRKKLPLPGHETAEALALLETSEGIKFAGAPATVEDAIAARDLTVRLVQRLFPGEARREK